MIQRFSAKLKNMQNNRVNNLIVKLGVLLMATIGVFASGASAARAELQVYINGQPVTNTSQPALFNIQDLLPGDSVPGTVRIVNTDTTWADAGVQAVTTGSNGLADHIYITISGTGMAAYNEKLSKFFGDSASGMLLSKINGGGEANYDFSINYPSNETEEQNAGVNFDLNFGVLDQGAHTFAVIGGQFGGNGGSAGQFVFEIRNVIGRRADDNSGSVKWETTKPANGRIIYSSQNEPHSFKYSATPLYGYSHIYPVIADSNYQVDHNFTLPNLDPCLDYYFRVVSSENGGQPTVSKDEYKIERAKNCEGRGNNFNPRVAGANTADTENGSPQLAGQVLGAETESRPDIVSSDSNPTVQTASAGATGTCWPNFPWWMFAIFPVFCAWRANVSEKLRKYWIAGGVISLVFTTWAFISQNYCLSWKVFVLIAIALTIAWIADRKTKTN